MPVDYKQNPTPDEVRFLRESQWIVGLAKGPAWAALKGELERMVATCRDIVENTETSNPQVIAGLHNRLKLTKAITSDIVKWVESTEEKRNQLMKELASEPTIEHLARIGDEFALQETDEYDTSNA
jgi:hypothetical protein